MRLKGPKMVEKRSRSEAIREARAHFTKTHIEIKRLGAGYDAEICLVIKRETLAALLREHNHQRATWKEESMKAYFDEVRSHVHVVKYNSQVDADLSKEIDVLTDVQEECHGIVAMLDQDPRPYCKQWFTMPLYYGGDLDHLSEGSAGALTHSFFWHVAIQLLETVVWMQFGVTLSGIATSGRPKQIPGWIPIYHNDIHSGNVFLQLRTKSSPTGFGNFPELVLGDFGKAKYGPELGHEMLSLKTQHRCYDVSNIGALVVSMFTECSGFDMDADFDAYFELGEWRETLKHARSLENLLDLIALAKIQREKLYQPLPAQVLRVLESEKVTDAELKHLLEFGSMR